jgi:hypothetical protein
VQDFGKGLLEGPGDNLTLARLVGEFSRLAPSSRHTSPVKDSYTADPGICQEGGTCVRLVGPPSPPLPPSARKRLGPPQKGPPQALACAGGEGVRNRDRFLYIEGD